MTDELHIVTGETGNKVAARLLAFIESEIRQNAEGNNLTDRDRETGKIESATVLSLALTACRMFEDQSGEKPQLRGRLLTVALS